MRGAGAVTEAEFLSYPNAPAPASAESAVQDLSGRVLPWVPKRQFTMTPTLRFPFAIPELPLVGTWVPRDLAFTTAFDVLYRSAMFLDGDLDPEVFQGGYWMVDARSAVSTADDSLSFALSVKNLTDEKVFEFRTDTPLFPTGWNTFQEFQRVVAFEARVQW